MKYLWNIVGVILGSLLIYDGINVAQTGIMFYKLESYGIIRTAGEYPELVGAFFILLGFWIIFLTISDLKNKIK